MHCTLTVFSDTNTTTITTTTTKQRHTIDSNNISNSVRLRSLRFLQLQFQLQFLLLRQRQRQRIRRQLAITIYRCGYSPSSSSRSSDTATVRPKRQRLLLVCPFSQLLLRIFFCSLNLQCACALRNLEQFGLQRGSCWHFFQQLYSCFQCLQWPPPPIVGSCLHSLLSLLTFPADCFGFHLQSPHLCRLLSEQRLFVPLERTQRQRRRRSGRQFCLLSTKQNLQDFFWFWFYKTKTSAGL